MIEYNDVYDIARKVYESLNIPEDISTTFDKHSVWEFSKQYSWDYIGTLVDAELQNLDLGGNSESEIHEIREDAVSMVMEQIDAHAENYYQRQEDIAKNAYVEIVDALRYGDYTDVVDVDTEYEPADPDVGVFHDERRIIITLSNGCVITLDVDIDD